VALLARLAVAHRVVQVVVHPAVGQVAVAEEVAAEVEEGVVRNTRLSETEQSGGACGAIS